jgi:hypothetical protein
MPASERSRCEQQALRCRLLGGGWLDDLEEAIGRHIAPERRAAWGIAEPSRNPFRSVSTQLGGTLYQRPPEIRGPNGSEELLEAIEEAGLWQLMGSVSAELVGLREALVRVDYSERGGLMYRPMPVECVIVEAVPEAPDVPARVEELQLRTHPETGAPAWVWEILDITDLQKPVHQVISGDRKEDWTEALLGGPRSGADFLYVDSTGRPFLPIVMYHAERTGRLWNSFYGLEAVLGTLTVGVLLTFWLHGVKDGSFSTVLIAGGRIIGAKVTSPSGVTTEVISTEPGSFIQVAPMEDYEGQVTAVQLQPGIDPEKLMSAIGMFEAGLAEYAGVSPADLLRTGADPRSGVSLAISREGLRGSQARFAPQLRRGDRTLIEATAKLLNAATGSSYPESGYSLSYPSLPLSSAEQAALRDDLLAKIEAGLMSKVDAYMRLHPGLTRDQAIAELRRIQTENASFMPTKPL